MGFGLFTRVGEWLYRLFGWCGGAWWLVRVRGLIGT
jgi:hypothetical protein